MNLAKAMKIVGGLLLIVLGLYSYVFWFPHLIDIIKGGFGLVLIVIGLLAIAIGSVD